MLQARVAPLSRMRSAYVGFSEVSVIAFGSRREGRLPAKGGVRRLDRSTTLDRLRSLAAQVDRTAERASDLPHQMAFHVHPQSLNYEKDLLRLQGEYNRMVLAAHVDGILTAADLAAEGLPVHYERS